MSYNYVVNGRRHDGLTDSRFHIVDLHLQRTGSLKHKESNKYIEKEKMNTTTRSKGTSMICVLQVKAKLECI